MTDDEWAKLLLLDVTCADCKSYHRVGDIHTCEGEFTIYDTTICEEFRRRDDRSKV